MEFAMYNPWEGLGTVVQEDQRVRWAVASGRIYKCDDCDAWHHNTEEEALQTWMCN